MELRQWNAKKNRSRTYSILLNVGILIAGLTVCQWARANSCRNIFSDLKTETQITFESDAEIRGFRKVQVRDQWTKEAIDQGFAIFREAGFEVPPTITVKRSDTFTAIASPDRMEIEVDYIDFFNQHKTEVQFKGPIVHEVGHLFWGQNIDRYAPDYSAKYNSNYKEMNSEDSQIRKRAKTEFRNLHALSLPYNELVADVTMLVSGSPLLLGQKKMVSNEEYRKFDSKVPLPWERSQNELFLGKNTKGPSENFEPDSLPHIRLAEVRRYIFHSIPRDQGNLLKILFKAIGKELDALIELPPHSQSDRELNRRLIERIKYELSIGNDLAN